MELDDEQAYFVSCCTMFQVAGSIANVLPSERDTIVGSGVEWLKQYSAGCPISAAKKAHHLIAARQLVAGYMAPELLEAFDRRFEKQSKETE